MLHLQKENDDLWDDNPEDYEYSWQYYNNK